MKTQITSAKIRRRVLVSATEDMCIKIRQAVQDAGQAIVNAFRKRVDGIDGYQPIENGDESNALPPINELTKQLACLLAAYETDEPHFTTVEKYKYFMDYGPDEPWPWEEVKEWSKREHCGDCTSMPAMCELCYIEAILHKAQWIAERIK